MRVDTDFEAGEWLAVERVAEYLRGIRVTGPIASLMPSWRVCGDRRRKSVQIIHTVEVRIGGEVDHHVAVECAMDASDVHEYPDAIPVVVARMIRQCVEMLAHESYTLADGSRVCPAPREYP